MNGLDVSRAVKEICVQKRIPKPPFILLTGWGGQVSANIAGEAGVDKIVSKPVSMLSLMEEIRKSVMRPDKESLVGWNAQMALNCHFEMTWHTVTSVEGRKWLSRSPNRMSAIASEYPASCNHTIHFCQEDYCEEDFCKGSDHDLHIPGCCHDFSGNWTE